ncbi:hypothetical protein MIND_00165100 [Mycena indigotica]|uniref:Fungal-type protein kinase domain-containing protein n=1 Tax=Mycena indigotica TaxID=2126181 RepID=A0A8H6TFL4_9AGAR|nr:uncharacterized protein MIND_00165100 [Mycena indigotica]KAF7316461.1 hypothetical protein MIND_00165100 [Mycena indigotica]
MDAIGMARCRSSIDLSDATSPLFDQTWDPNLHKTRFAFDNARQRLHTRTLLTPVGSSIENFPSTKRVVEALLNVSIHLEIAYDAGIIHRDVSVGNILFVEDTSTKSSVAGFLVDWDYAELTQDGIKRFNEVFVTPGSNRLKASWEEIKETLKEMTGTFAFMAIAILEERGERHDTVHDLESVYWVLIWLILRHTKHSHPHGANACHNLYDAPESSGKLQWLNSGPSTAPLPDKETPLHKLLLEMARMVYLGAVRFEDLRQSILHEKWCAMLRDALGKSGWPVDDAAIPYQLVSANQPHLNGESARQSQARERKSLQQQQLEAPVTGPLKRGSDKITGNNESQARKKRRTTPDPPSSRPATFEGSP